jgi:ABC-type lipoprotein export system ATPase subunit
VAALLSMFWLLPFYLREPFFNDMGWERLEDVASGLFTGPMRVALPIAAVGMLLAFAVRDRVGILFATMALISAAMVERRARVDEVLGRMDIAHRGNHFPSQLSGGQQQRVAVARALVVRPKLILADEPTGNLDSEHGDEVMRLLKQLNAEGTTILMVTHSAPNAQFSKRMVNLLDGKVVSDRANGQQ